MPSFWIAAVIEANETSNSLPYIFTRLIHTVNTKKDNAPDTSSIQVPKCLLTILLYTEMANKHAWHP